MKIIITGATGFVGRNLAESLHEDGVEIVATGRSAGVGEELSQRGISFTTANITDPSQVDKLFSKADCVIHCAAKTADWGRYKAFYQANLIGTQNIIQACRSYDIKKIIFISTPSVYYTGKDRFNIVESDPLPDKQFHYGKTKLMAEEQLMALETEGFKTIILRPRALYGPHDHTIVPRILQLSDKKNFPLINHGNALIDITYIENFIDAVGKCLCASDEAWNEIYNVSNGDPIRVKEWFALVLKIFEREFNPKNIPEPVAKSLAALMEFLSLLPFGNQKPALTKFSVGYMAKSMTMSIEKARQQLDYVPKISNQQGFERYKEWIATRSVSREH